MRIAIVEDESQQAEQLRDHIIKYCNAKNEIADIVCFNDGIDIISEYTCDYDIIFLDIVMKHMNGMKTAERIRNIDKRAILFFVSVSGQYALQGYDYVASGYFVKPVDYSLLESKLDRVMESIRTQSKDFIVIRAENGANRIELKDILYIESQNHKMYIHTVNGVYQVYDTMRRLSTVLSLPNFLRCNNCYIVNVAYVTAVQGEYVSVRGTPLKISRSRRKAVGSILTEEYKRVNNIE